MNLHAEERIFTLRKRFPRYGLIPHAAESFFTLKNAAAICFKPFQFAGNARKLKYPAYGLARKNA